MTAKSIVIDHKLAPFSHCLGTLCLIPGTHFAVKVYPALLLLYDISDQKSCIKEISLPLIGPICGFTTQLDLEKGEVRVFGKQGNGKYFLYSITKMGTLYLRKGFSKKETLHLFDGTESVPIKERLFLGKTKKLEWEKVKQREDLAEIFPIWLLLGSFYNENTYPICKGAMSSLLDKCKEILAKKEHDKIFQSFHSLFLCFFESMLLPRLIDTEYQGIIPHEKALLHNLNCSSSGEFGLGHKFPLNLNDLNYATKPHENANNGSPLPLLKESSTLIRSLFFQVIDKTVLLLPHLPPECPSGKMVHIEIPNMGCIHFEWTKKNMRRLLFHSLYSGSLLFLFPTHIKSFRIRCDLKERGEKVGASLPLNFKSGVSYLFDRFED